MGLRSIIYIDGFNLYYGVLKGGPYKWLDLQLFFERLRQDDDVQQIRFFTAKIDGARQGHQLMYWRALATRPKVQIIEGKFKIKRLRCEVAACSFTGPRFFTKMEEKRTDVAIAVNLLDDAYQDRADLFVIVSGDSDLVPGVQLLKRRFPQKRVVVYVPSNNETRGAAVELRAVADKDRTLPLVLLKRSQFPASFPDGTGGLITKPPGW